MQRKQTLDDMEVVIRDERREEVQGSLRNPKTKRMVAVKEE